MNPPDSLRIDGRRVVGRPRIARGFTLIELVVVIILVGVLAAIAAPRFLSLAREARIAAVKTLAGAVTTAANTVHTACGVSPGCDYGNYNQIALIDNRYADLDYGWPNSGDNLGSTQIDIWLVYDGFTATIPAFDKTQFSRDDAPDPTQCAVTYEEATFHADHMPTVTTLTDGC